MSSVPPNPSTSHSTESNSGPLVLVVDDFADSVFLLKRLLERSGLRVETAEDGPEALEVAKRTQPGLAFLDIGMPGMTGYELAPMLREQVGSLKNGILVAVTGYGSPEDLKNGMEAGFDNYLVKPIDIVRLKTAIDLLLATGHLGLESLEDKIKKIEADDIIRTSSNFQELP